MADKAHKKDFVALKEMKVETVPIDSIKPNDYNPNRQGPREFELLCKSIATDGFTQPVVAIEIPEAERSKHGGKRGIIVDGFHRWKACRHLGMTEIAVVFTNMSEAQRRISTLRHNRARGSEDPALVAQMMRDLADDGAVDWMQDQLMLDDVEVKHLIALDTTLADTVRAAAEEEAHLRADEEGLTEEEEAAVASDLVRTKMHESKHAVFKGDVKQNFADEEAIYTVRLVFADPVEVTILKRALGKGSTERQERFLEICGLAAEGTI